MVPRSCWDYWTGRPKLPLPPEWRRMENFPTPTGKRCSSTSGSVTRVLVMWLCIALVRSWSGRLRFRVLGQQLTTDQGGIRSLAKDIGEGASLITPERPFPFQCCLHESIKPLWLTMGADHVPVIAHGAGCCQRFHAVGHYLAFAVCGREGFFSIFLLTRKKSKPYNRLTWPGEPMSGWFFRHG